MPNIFEELMRQNAQLTESQKRTPVTVSEARKINPKKLRVESRKFLEDIEDYEEVDAQFDVTPEDAEKSDKDEVVLVIDPEASPEEEVPEDAAEELVGDYVYKCPVCGANYVCACDAAETEAIEVDEDGVPTECPICGDDSDQILIGEIAPVEGAGEETDLEPVDADEGEEVSDDEEEFEAEEETEEIEEESLKRRSYDRRVTEAKKDSSCTECDKRAKGKEEDKPLKEKNKSCKVKESAGEDQKWVDYDEKHYGKISKATKKAIEDDDLEVIDGDYKGRDDKEVVAKEAAPVHRRRKVREAYRGPDYVVPSPATREIASDLIDSAISQFGGSKVRKSDGAYAYHNDDDQAREDAINWIKGKLKKTFGKVREAKKTVKEDVDFCEDGECDEEEFVEEEPEIEFEKETKAAVNIDADVVNIELDDKRFESMMIKMIRENYKNNPSFKLTRASACKNQLKLEYVVRAGKKNIKGVLVAEGYSPKARKMTLKFKDKGAFTESFTKAPAFIVECVTIRNKVVPTSIKYNFTKKVNESLYRIKGEIKTSKSEKLKESVAFIKKKHGRGAYTVSVWNKSGLDYRGVTNILMKYGLYYFEISRDAWGNISDIKITFKPKNLDDVAQAFAELNDNYTADEIKEIAKSQGVLGDPIDPDSMMF